MEYSTLRLVEPTSPLEGYVRNVGRRCAKETNLPDAAASPNLGVGYFWTHTASERADTGPLNRIAAAK